MKLITEEVRLDINETKITFDPVIETKVNFTGLENAEIQ